jgi:hypothetical protein
MEIHHKHHHDPPGKHDKLWKHYVLEFIMLFLAVSLGFFVENMREHYSEHNREREYMKSMVEDLKADTATLAFDLKFNETIRLGLDSLRNIIYAEGVTKNNTVLIYRLMYSYGRLVGTELNDQTITQLRNTGGMQFIRNIDIANAISKYSLGIKSLENISDNYKNRWLKTSDFGYAIFNRKYVLSQHTDSLTHIITAKIDSAARLLTTDENTLITFANHLSGCVAISSSFYPINLKKQYAEAIKLIADIRKEYNFE